MSVTIKINKDDINWIHRSFKVFNDELPGIQSRAINRALQTANRVAKEEVMAVYGLTATRVKKDFKTKKTTRNDLRGWWRAQGRPVGLRQFSARQNQKGVSVIVLKKTGRLTVYGAFIRLPRSPKVRRTGEQVYWRAMKGGVRVWRDPIHRLEGPRVEDALTKPGVQKRIKIAVNHTINKRLMHEADRLMQKAGKL